MYGNYPQTILNEITNYRVKNNTISYTFEDGEEQMKICE